MEAFQDLLARVRACTICSDALEHGVRPVLQLTTGSKLLIVGQAPGRRVHASGVPFDDPSGDRLRAWMGVDRETFYDAEQVAILPMGFCYPGTGKNGDLPPRPECAPAWRAELLAHLPQALPTLVIGKYAIDWHLPDAPGNLTETVRAWRSFPSHVLPLPHPSPRNNIWMKKNAWFEAEVLPELQARVKEALER